MYRSEQKQQLGLGEKHCVQKERAWGAERGTQGTPTKMSHLGVEADKWAKKEEMGQTLGAP